MFTVCNPLWSAYLRCCFDSCIHCLPGSYILKCGNQPPTWHPMIIVYWYSCPCIVSSHDDYTVNRILWKWQRDFQNWFIKDIFVSALLPLESLVLEQAAAKSGCYSAAYEEVHKLRNWSLLTRTNLPAMWVSHLEIRFSSPSQVS